MKKNNSSGIYSNENLKKIWIDQISFFKAIRFKRTQIFIFILFLVSFVCVKLYNGFHWNEFYKQNYHEIFRSHDTTGLTMATESGVSYAKTLVTPGELSKLNFNIKFEDWKAITKTRNKYLNTWHNMTDEPYRKVIIDWQGKKIKGKIRLKGIGTDHREDKKKWSYAIKLKSDNYIMGLSDFSVQSPKTREYWSECLFNKSLQNEGLIAPYCDQVELFINGDRVGIMTLTERMSKGMLERQGRKEGVIAKPYYSNIWLRLNKIYKIKIENKNDETKFKGDMTKVILNRLVAPLTYFNSKSISNNEALQKQQYISTQLFNGMLQGNIAPSEIFDVDQVGKALAVTFFWGNFHSFQIHNLKFYFNPITFKFEAIPTDASAVGNNQLPFLNSKSGVKGTAHLLYLLISDKKIRNSFQKRVKHYASRFENIGIFGSEFPTYSSEQHQKLQKDYKMLPKLSMKALFRRYENNKEDINNDTFFKKIEKNSNFRAISFPSDYQIIEPIYLLIINETDKAFIHFKNTLPQNMELKRVDLVINGKEESLKSHDFPAIIPPTYSRIYDNGIKVGELKIPLKNLNIDDKVQVTAIVSPVGQNSDYTITSIPYNSAASVNPISPSDLSAILYDNPFLKATSDNKALKVLPGRWTVNNFIKLPYNIDLHMEAGTVLSFSKNAGMLIRGHVNLKGNINSPIIMNAVDPEQGWAGFTVMEANSQSSENRSFLEHVYFKNTQAAHYKTWELTGAVNFYKSDVTLSHVSFYTTMAEDALNIIHSEFNMDNAEITKTRSDGFDGDFTNGIILNSRFYDIGGDGIDFSGSKIKVSDSHFSKIHDKAVSVGEATNLSAYDLLIENSGTGIVSKDGSLTTIENSIFKNIKYSSMMSYMKKPQYRGANLIAKNVSFEENKLAVIVQKKSKATINDRVILPIKVNIDKIYKEGYMKK